MSALSSEARALIDAAVRAGQVRQIPRGVSSFPLPVWDGRKLRSPDAAERVRAVQASTWQRRMTPELRATIERREAVGRLHAEGLPIWKIARELDVCRRTISADHKVLGLESRQLCSRAPEAIEAREQRRARVAELMEQGLSNARIGALVGCSAKAVFNDKIYLRAQAAMGKAA